MDNPVLHISMMPASAIVKNFVDGEEQCNYEIYLRELLNASDYFFNKGGSNYLPPISEEAGQHDAISSKYEIDFKILATQTAMRAKSILSMRPTVITPGIVIYESPVKPNGSETITRLQAALRGISQPDLEETRRAKSSCTNTENDLPEILDTVEVKKNALFLFPYVFSFAETVDDSQAQTSITNALEKDFKQLLLYREKYAPGFETYFTTVYKDTFLLFRCKEGSFSLIEAISTAKTPTYRKLIDYNNIWS